MRLPRLPNNEFQRAERLAAMSGVPLEQCPTCLAATIVVDDDVTGWENGTYKYRGETIDCDCETQMNLRKHYFVANIGDQYQRLDWKDYRGDDKVRDSVQLYLDKWDKFKIHGMGVEFSSVNLGVGKTFGATHIGKELIKRGEKVFFIPFLEVISVLSKQHHQSEDYERRLYETTVLILDEVIPPWTAPQENLFAGKFEELIRNRTNFNRVTIMTTNLRPEALHINYPRPYSLLAAKQLRIEMQGTDARQSFIEQENMELIMNDEVRPIT